MAPASRPAKPVGDRELKALLSAEITSALGYLGSDELSADREKANRFYKGDLSKDLPSPGPGRSAAVSSDVQDTVEGIMPSILEIFTAGDEIARFEPVGPEDEEGAQQETDYVNHVFYQQNQGFLVIHDAVKDALLNKTGIIKFWHEKYTEEVPETYDGIDEETLGVLLSNEEYTLTQQTQRPDGLLTVKVICRKESGRTRVEAVAPEEFLIARSVRTNEDEGFRGHITHPTQQALVEMGCDAALVEKLETWSGSENMEATARDTAGESDGGAADELNRQMRQVEVVEALLHVDVDGDGTPERRKVLCSRDGQIILLNEEDDTTGFSVGSPIRVAHRIIGRSIADLVLDIQLLNSAVYRQLLDNMYRINNARPIVTEAATGENTIADLLSTTPGAPIRVKGPGGLDYAQTPSLGPYAFPLLEFFQTVKEKRTGVTGYNQGTDADSLNKTASGISQIMSAAQMRTRLIARILAETLVKPALLGVHKITLKFGRKAETVRLRNKWVQVDPSQWKNRSDMQITVALGTGSREMNVANLQALMGIQAEMLKNGAPIVTMDNLFGSATKLAQEMGYKSPEMFFTDPKTLQPQQPKPDPAMVKVQADAQAQQAKLQGDMQLGMAKVQNEKELGVAKIQTEREIALLKTRGDMALQAGAQRNEQENAAFEAANQKFDPKDGTPSPVKAVGDQIVAAVVQATQESNAQLAQVMQQGFAQMVQAMQTGFGRMEAAALADTETYIASNGQKRGRKVAMPVLQ